MGRMKWLAIAGSLAMVLFAPGCAQSAPQQASTVDELDAAASPAAPRTEPGKTAQASRPSADFNGNWSVEWCDKTNPGLDCGGFSVTLVQEGERVCGDYGGALVNMRQIDEGDIVGTVVGDIAVLSVESSRNSMIALVRAELRGSELHWKEVDSIKKGGTDIAIIATNDVLAQTPTERQDTPRRCNSPASLSQEQ